MELLSALPQPCRCSALAKTEMHSQSSTKPRSRSVPGCIAITAMLSQVPHSPVMRNACENASEDAEARAFSTPETQARTVSRMTSGSCSTHLRTQTKSAAQPCESSSDRSHEGSLGIPLSWVDLSEALLMASHCFTPAIVDKGSCRLSPLINGQNTIHRRYISARTW
jgi:hypothetical protein